MSMAFTYFVRKMFLLVFNISLLRRLDLKRTKSELKIKICIVPILLFETSLVFGSGE